MMALQRISGIAKADFLERVRKFSFPAFAAFLVFSVFWFVPRPSGFTGLVIEPDRFLQGSDPSWIPISSALCGGTFLCLLGFVYIKNAVRQDHEAGILTLVQTSSLKRSTYLFGKFLSNVCLLLLLLVFLMAASFLTMVVRFPGRFIPLQSFFSPFLCIIPGLFFVSAFALLTDCAPVFRKNSSLSIGLYFCLFVLILTFGSLNRNPYRLTSIFDFSGFMWIHDSISRTVTAVTGQPATRINLFSYSREAGSQLKTLVFHGLMPSAAYFSDKLIMIALSLGLTGLASLLLPKSQNPVFAAAKKQLPQAIKNAPARIPFFHFGVFRSQMTILLKSQSFFWWSVAVCLWIANLFSPMDTVRSALFPLAFVWLLPVFSKMGYLEHQTGMIIVLRTIPNAPLLQALFCWRAGLAISFFTSLPVLLRLFLSQNFAGFLAVIIFTIFIPTSALFLGEWTKSNRPFEILYLILCFLMMNLPTLVFTDSSFSVQSGLRACCFILITVGMLVLAFAARLKTIRVTFK